MADFYSYGGQRFPYGIPFAECEAVLVSPTRFIVQGMKQYGFEHLTYEFVGIGLEVDENVKLAPYGTTLSAFPTKGTITEVIVTTRHGSSRYVGDLDAFSLMQRIEAVNANYDDDLIYINAFLFDGDDRFFRDGDEGAPGTVVIGDQDLANLNDSLTGTVGADSIYGLTGNDIIYATEGADYVDGGTGDDVIYVDGLDVGDRFLGRDGYDTIVLSNDSPIENIGRANIVSFFERLVVGSADEIEILSGTDGDNLFDLSLFQSVLGSFDLLAGDDTFVGGYAGEMVSGGAGDDVLSGAGGDDVLDGAEGADVLAGGEGNDTLIAGAGDTVSGGLGYDVLRLGGETSRLVLTPGRSIEELRGDELSGTSGDDVIYLDGLTKLLGGSIDLLAGNDDFRGSAADETIFGGDGDDTLYGGIGGLDSLDGGAGNDLFYVTSAAYALATLQGGEGDDTLSIYGSSGAASLIVGAGSSIETLEGSAIYGTSGANIFDLTEVAEVNVGHFALGGGHDSFVGSASGEYVVGEAGDDSLAGRGGNDTLVGGVGRDSLDGGDGNDALYLSTVGSLDGGAGDDVLYVPTSAIAEATLIGGDGHDILVLSYTGTPYRVILDLGAAASIEELYGSVFYGTSQADKINLSGVSKVSVSGFQLGAGSDEFLGSAGVERVDGGAGDDTLLGGGGNDTLSGGGGLLSGGRDSLDGGDGNDSLEGISAGGTLQGGAGDDWLHVTDVVLPHVTLSGGDGDDTLFIRNSATQGFATFAIDAASSIETLAMQGGSTIYGTSGADRFELAGLSSVLVDFDLGRGDDAFAGSGAAEIVYAGDGDDSLGGGGGADQLYAGLGDDVAFGGDGMDTLGGDVGNDSLDGGADDDTLFGRAGDDTLLGGGGDDDLTGHGGADSLEGGDGDDSLNGDGGNDLLFAGLGDDTLRGGDGADLLGGDVGNDVLEGGAGRDTLLGRAGDDALLGGEGDDTLTGHGGDDRLGGGAGRDDLAGSEGADTLNGAADSDTIDGGAGDDRVAGGEGQDMLTGGEGRDRFVFDAALKSKAADVITDYSTADDRFVLDASIFVNTNIGPLARDAFVLGTRAEDLEDRIIYDATSGSLWFDLDGSGRGKKALFATVDPDTAIDHREFDVL
jgi:Ca2+-binding RTX toxin-like protein